MRGADKIEACNLYYTSSKVYEVKMVVDDDLEDCFKINHIKFISSLLLITPSDSDKVGHDPQTLNSHGIDCGDAGWMDGWQRKYLQIVCDTAKLTPFDMYYYYSLFYAADCIWK